MKQIFGVIITFLIVILYGCEYNSDEVFYRNVDKNVVPPDLTIDLNLTSDTTYFYSNPSVTISLKQTNKVIYGVKFYVNNVEVKNVSHYNNQDYSIWVDASSNYINKVKAEIYTSTGTGSIADKVNAESFVVQTKEWVLIYVPEQPKLQTDVVDGRLKLSWTPVKSSVKLKYYIYSSSHSKDLIDSTYNNWYIDSSYFGGSSKFSVKYGRNGLSGYYAFTDLYYPLPKVKIINRDSFLISWDSYKLYNNIKGIRLRIDTSSINLKPTDSIYVCNKYAVFGKNYDVRIDLCLKDNYYYRYSYYYDFANLNINYPGSFLPDYNFFSSNYFPLTGSSFYYMSTISNQTYLFKFSVDSKSTNRSRNMWTNYFSVSPNNKYILYEDASMNLQLLETDGLQSVKSIPTTQIVSYPGIYGNVVVSDIGTSVFYDQAKQVMVVYDFIGNKTITEIPVSTLIKQFKISAGGKYMFFSDINTLYKVENNSYTEVWSNKSNASQFTYLDFFPENQEKICLYDGSTFYIKNSFDFTTISSFSIKDRNIVNVDFQNQKILTVANGNYFIYSLTTGDLLQTIPTSFNSPDRVRLFNDYIIASSCQLNLNINR